MEVRSIEGIPLMYQMEGDEVLQTGRDDVIDSRPMTLVRVETADGTVGWGEAFGPPRTNVAILEEVVEGMVLGMDPYEVESLCERSYSALYHMARRGPLQCALSAVDIALWDIRGKATGEPVFRLLGGPNRTEVTPYASTMMRYDRSDESTETDSTAQLEAARKEGFTAAKIKIGRNIEDDVRRVEAAREVLGEDGSVMVDINGNYATDQAVRAVEALDRYDLAWIEEPILPHHADTYPRVAAHTTTPLAAGEAVYSRYGFKDLMSNGQIDIVQPDVTKVGGFSEARFVADLATTTNTRVSPHCWNGPVGLAATLQFAAAAPKYPHSGRQPEPFFVEVDRSNNPMRDAILADQYDPTGRTVEVPDRPGIGIQPDPDAIDRYRIDT